MNTFDEYWEEEEAYSRGRTPEEGAKEIAKKAWDAALKDKKAPVAEVPCGDRLCAELSLMLDVFNSCIETKTLPKAGSPCQEKIIELLKRCGKEPTALKVRGA